MCGGVSCRTRRLVLSLAIVPFMAAALACSVETGGSSALAASISDPKGQPHPSDRPQLAVRRGEFRQLVLLTGELKAVSGHPVVVPPLPTWEIAIRRIVEDGTFVNEGDSVAELDTTQIASQLAEKETAREQAINMLRSKRAEVSGNMAEKEFGVERTRIALEKAKIAAAVPEDVQSRRQYQEAQLALEQARVELDKAVAELESYQKSSEAELEVVRIDLTKAERDVAEAQRAIDTMVLHAPVSGLVVVGENFREGRKFQVGDTAWQGAELLEIPDLATMMVEAKLSDVDDGKIAPGMRVNCRLDAYPDSPIGGVIRSISPVAHGAGRRSMQRHFQVLIDLDSSNPDVMLPGMSVKTEVETALQEDVALVPRAALLFESDGVFALLDDGRREPLEIGPCNAFECILETGLPVGTLLAATR